MKKQIYAVIFAVSALASCGNLSQYTTVGENASVKAKLRACMLNEANAKFQEGTLLSKSLTETADEISDTCIKRLALQAAGLDTEAASNAQTILNNLINAAD